MNDEEYAALMLRPLAGEPIGPPGIDVPKAMRDGRRLRGRRWWTGSLVIVLVSGLITGGVLLAPGRHETPPPNLPPEPAVPAACTPAKLPIGNHKGAAVDGGDSTGRWLIGSADALTPQRSTLVWHDAELVTDLLAAGNVSDINSSGIGIGSALVQGRGGAFVVQDGRIRPLPGGAGTGVAINDAGVIAGTLGQGDKERPARWRTPDSPPEVLDAVGRARVVDIAPDGTIAIIVFGPFTVAPAQVEGGPQPVLRESSYTALWTPDGKVQAVTRPDGVDFQAIGFAYGWLYGGSGFPALLGPEAQQRYHPATGTWQEMAAPPRVAQIVGPGRFGKFLASTPAIYVGKAVLNLPPDLDAVRKGSGDFEVESASDDAHVVAGTGVGVNSDPTKPFQPVIWRCR